MAYKDPLDPRARAARRRHYHANKQQYLDRNARQKAAQVEWLREQKNVPCADCGQRYPYYVMDFDHLPGEGKVSEVGRLLGGSWKKLMDEVAKCDVVCSNCHRERTHQRLS